MATTTNYGWTTPNDTDLVKDGASAIRTLGSSIDTTTKALNPETTLGDIAYRSATANTNTRLAIGTTGQVLTVAGGVPTWATSDDANAIQNALLTTTGDTIYASGASTPARLGIGSTGQVLTVAGGVPSWATPAGGGGKVLQVVQATYSTQTSNSTSTYADTGLTVNITPSAATSKVLVFYSLAASKSSGNSNNGLNLKLLRGATVIAGYESIGLGYTGTAIQSNFNVAQQYLDSPSTTSATTYKLQFCNDTIQASVSVQHANTASIITLMEIGA
jgi:hypothetical protein